MAGAKVRGITIELSADASGINDGLKKANSAINSTQKELRDIEKLLKLDPTNVTLLAQKHEALQKQIGNTREKLDLLKKAEEDLKKQMEDGGTEEQKKQLAALQREIISTEKDLDKYTDQLEETGKETKDLTKEEQNATEATGKMKEGFTVLKGALASLVAEGIRKAADGFKELMTAGPAYADEILTLASKTSMATDKMQELSYMSDLVDVDVSKVTSSMTKLTKNMAAARKGSGSAYEAFKQLHVEFEDGNGKLRDNEEVFYDLIEALGQMEEGSERDAIAMNLFGKSATDLNPMIEAGSDKLREFAQEAHDMGYVLDEDALESLGRVQDEFDRFERKMVAVKNQIASGLAPAVERGMKRINESVSKIDWNKVGRDIGKAFDKLVDAFEWIIKHGGEIKAILSGIVAAFAVTKVASFATAVHGMISALISATAAQEGLNAAVMANPYVALAAAIAACVTAFVALENESWKNYQSTDANWQKTNELTAAIEEHCDAIDSACAAYQTLEEARQETLNSGMAEMAHVQSLSDELATLADESGNVTDQDRARAAFILGELNNALGTEYTMTGNVIDNYNELTGAIDALIEKKKAELILQAEENAYREAIINRADAERNLEAIENDRIATETQLQDVTRQKNEILAMSSTEVAKHQFELSQLDAQEMKLRKALEQTNGAYENARDLVGRYTHDITQYEDNMTKSLEGDYDQIQHKSWETAKAEQDAAEQASTAMAKATEKGASDMVSAMTNASKNIPDGVASGINQNAWQAINAAATLAQQITAAYNNNMGIHSPSTVMEASTKWWIKGFPVGIKKNKEIAFKSIDQFGADITQRMNRSMNRVKMPAGGYDYSVFAGSKAAAQTAGGYGIEEIAGLLQRYLPDLANMKVVLDGETTVGKLAPGINRALGRIQTAEARGM